MKCLILLFFACFVQVLYGQNFYTDQNNPLNPLIVCDCDNWHVASMGSIDSTTTLLDSTYYELNNKRYKRKYYVTSIDTTWNDICDAPVTCKGAKRTRKTNGKRFWNVDEQVCKDFGKFTIWASSFIPDAETPPVPLPFFAPPPLIAFLHLKGDSRTYGEIGGGARLWHKLIIDTNPDLTNPLVPGTSDSKASSTSGYIEVLGIHVYDFTTDEGPKPPLAEVTKDGCNIKVHITGQATTQILPDFIAPIIKYEFDLIFDTKEGTLTYSGSYVQWLFPQYELVVSPLTPEILIKGDRTYNPLATPLNFLTNSTINVPAKTVNLR